jgi:hypothetical protein
MIKNFIVGGLCLVAMISFAACNRPEPKAAPAPAPIESPLGNIVTPKPIMVEEKKPISPKAKKEGTPRLDALEKRVRGIEDKITKYERQYGQ